MKKRPIIKTKQPTSDELLNELLDFVRRKFYPSQAVAFAKDKPRLLHWVILWPAEWLNKRGVTIPGSRYREIFEAVLMDALRFGKTHEIKYLPAWLRQTMQSHFAMHGDEIYAHAKAMRNLVENAIVTAGRQVQKQADPVRELAAAKRLLVTAKGAKRAVKRPGNGQLSLI